MEEATGTEELSWSKSTKGTILFLLQPIWMFSAHSSLATSWSATVSRPIFCSKCCNSSIYSYNGRLALYCFNCETVLTKAIVYLTTIVSHNVSRDNNGITRGRECYLIIAENTKKIFINTANLINKLINKIINNFMNSFAPIVNKYIFSLNTGPG